MEYALIIGCLGFAMTASMRSSQHKLVHEEEVQELNYEIAELEEQIERYQTRWQSVEATMKEQATVQRNGDLLVPLKVVQDLVRLTLSSEPMLPQNILSFGDGKKLQEMPNQASKAGQGTPPALGTLRLPHDVERVILY